MARSHTPLVVVALTGFDGEIGPERLRALVDALDEPAQRERIFGQMFVALLDVLDDAPDDERPLVFVLALVAYLGRFGSAIDRRLRALEERLDGDRSTANARYDEWKEKQTDG